jgi:hypothetical protein
MKRELANSQKTTDENENSCDELGPGGPAECVLLLPGQIPALRP